VLWRLHLRVLCGCHKVISADGSSLQRRGVTLPYSLSREMLYRRVHEAGRRASWPSLTVDMLSEAPQIGFLRGNRVCRSARADQPHREIPERAFSATALTGLGR
jgi:hypothetical protein